MAVFRQTWVAVGTPDELSGETCDVELRNGERETVRILAVAEQGFDPETGEKRAQAIIARTRRR